MQLVEVADQRVGLLRRLLHPQRGDEVAVEQLGQVPLGGGSAWEIGVNQKYIYQVRFIF